MKHKIRNNICTLISIFMIGASPLWAETSNTKSSKGVTVKVPPEKRVVVPQIDMPEHAMTRAIKKEIEDKKHQPIKDQAGNIQYIVTFTDDALLNYADSTDKDSRFADWHDSTVIRLLHDTEKTHKFSATHLYSQTIHGFAAFLTPQQVIDLGQDRNIDHLTPSLSVEFNGGIWNDAITTYMTTPWGVQAVGGGISGNNVGVNPVYVIDSGVGVHPSLNVTSRWAVPGACIVGQYPHATFVAGIIGATNYGVFGVDPFTNIVSLAYGDKICGVIQNVPNVIVAFEEAKRRIQLSGRVAVINFSTNFENLGLNIDFLASVKRLITPAPTFGYPGAFFVQSAGNYAKDACAYGYNTGLPGSLSNNVSDGAMVVGAIDSNGQPVQKINDDFGFNLENPTFTVSEPGSNFGPCVDVWAPGKNIKSTWMNPSGKPTYTYATGSGTSFAAPHIAGIAAYLIETFPNLLTPADVENAVRARLVGNGATSHGLPVKIVNINSTNYNARPTVEFKINSGSTTRSSSAPAPIGVAPYPTIYPNSNVTLRFDTVGATSCVLKSYINDGLSYTSNFPLNGVNAYDWKTIQLQPGQYRWDVSCLSPNGAINTATASAKSTALPSETLFANFIFNGEVQDNGVSKDNNGGAFTLSYHSYNTTTCDITAYSTPVGGIKKLEYTKLGFPTSYNWGEILAAAHTAYQWTIVCKNAGFPNRGVVSSTFNLKSK
ncbi:MAG: S8 family serine peptidase [Candidatus Nitrotoga sp.]